MGNGEQSKAETPWYKDSTNALVVNHEHGDFAATAMVYGAELTDLRLQLQGAVSDEAAKRFRDALAPGFIVWHDGRRLSPEDTLAQIKRGLLAALGISKPPDHGLREQATAKHNTLYNSTKRGQ